MATPKDATRAGKPHIFLSFKTEERASAAELKNALVAAGHAVWWSEDIQCGREWHGDIDLALSRAGCVVVLWSRASMSSPWVRHEASQAIARGIYAPVRLEPIEIESPYNRIQATDLLNWTGETTHAGWMNLNARIDELLPPPVPLVSRVRVFVRRQAFTVGAVAFGVIATALLAQLSRTLGDQVTQQAEIARDIQRTLQPIQGLEVRAFVELGTDTRGLAEYVDRLRTALLPPEGTKLTADWLLGADAKSRGLTAGEGFLRPLPLLRPTRTSTDGTVEELAIDPTSPLWVKDVVLWVVRGVELNLAFRRDGVAPGDDAPPLQTADGRAIGADLSFDVGAHDPDGSDQPRGNVQLLLWEPGTGRVTVQFTDVPLPKGWTSTNQIVSVPDLEASSLTVTFKSILYPSNADDAFEAFLTTGRKHLQLSTLFLTYSGRQLMLRGQDMRERRDRWGLRAYSADLGDRAVARRN